MAFYACTFTHCSVNYFAVESEFSGRPAKKASLPKIGKLLKYLARASMMGKNLTFRNFRGKHPNVINNDFLLFSFLGGAYWAEASKFDSLLSYKAA